MLYSNKELNIPNVFGLQSAKKQFKENQCIDTLAMSRIVARSGFEAFVA